MATNDSTTKRCTRCGVEYPATLEYFSPNRKMKSGLQSICKPCYREWKRRYDAEHPEKSREASKRYRTNHPEKVRDTQRRWIKKHPNYDRQRYAKNPEKQRAASKARRDRDLEKSRRLDRDRYAKQPYKKLASNRRYYARNPDKFKLRNHKRRSHENSLPNTFTGVDWRRCLDYWNHCCCICDRPVGLWHTLAQEHWIPITDPRPDNPGTVATNIVPMCHSLKDGEGGCNNSKWTTDPIDWLNRKFGKRKAKVILARIETYFEWVALQSNNL